MLEKKALVTHRTSSIDECYTLAVRHSHIGAREDVVLVVEVQQQQLLQNVAVHCHVCKSIRV
jgi:hypothetical protein